MYFLENRMGVHLVYKDDIYSLYSDTLANEWPW